MGGRHYREDILRVLARGPCDPETLCQVVAYREYDNSFRQTLNRMVFEDKTIKWTDDRPRKVALVNYDPTAIIVCSPTAVIVGELRLLKETPIDDRYAAEKALAALERDRAVRAVARALDKLMVGLNKEEREAVIELLREGP